MDVQIMTFRREQVFRLNLRRGCAILKIFLCLLLLGSVAASATDIQIKPWWNFVVSLDVQYGDSRQTGAGLIVGRLRNLGDFGGSDSLLILTANHVVRFHGQTARSIAVRLPWSEDRPLAGTLTGLQDAADDITLISVRADEFTAALPFSVVGCVAELKSGARIRLGDLTGGISGIAGPKEMGNFAGVDEHGNLQVGGLAVVEGRSGSPLMNEDGAILAILSSPVYAAHTGFAVGVPMQRLVNLFPDESYVDSKLQPISKASGSASVDDNSVRLGCVAGTVDCEMHCASSCDPDKGGIASSQACADCQSKYSSCRGSQTGRCRQFGANPPDRVYWIEWFYVPACHCVDAGLGATYGPTISYKGLRNTCSEPGLAAQIEEALGPEISSQLAKRFPAMPSDFSAYLTEKSPGSVWQIYRERIQEAATDDAEQGSDTQIATTLGAVFLSGLPICLRSPAELQVASARNLERWLDLNDASIVKISGGVTWCQIPVNAGDELKIPLLQLGRKWIYFPTNP
jgi:hypothetical protein